MNRKARRSNKNRIPTKRFFKTSLVTVGALLATQTLLTPQAFATEPSVFTVTNCEDSGAGSLRSAMEAVNEHRGQSQILFALNSSCSVITPLTVLPQIVNFEGDSLDIVGPGADQLTIDGSNFSFNSNLEFQASDIKVSGLTFNRLHIYVNNAFQNAALEIDSVNFENLDGWAAIENYGHTSNPVLVTNSTFGYSGSVEGSTAFWAITTNTDLEVDNSTFIGNVFQEGVLVLSGYGEITISNSTFVDNTINDSDYINVFDIGQPNLSLFGNIFANNDFSPSFTNCGFSVDDSVSAVDNGANLFDVVYPGCTTDSSTSRVFANLRSTLANEPSLNGGTTPTVALLSGSPAIDFYTDGVDKRSLDQRGFSRPSGSGYDVGAFEFQGVTASSNSTTCIPKTLGSVRFKFNSDTLTKTTKEALDLYSNSIAKSGCKLVTLNGHTAATGKTTKAKTKYRQQLANKRALAVEDYLKSSLKKFNSSVTIKTNAQGALNPLGSNENESGRKKNRRVEISIN